MLDDLDETLRQLLIAEMPIKNGEVEISFEQPRRENSVRWGKPTVNLFLYDLRENNVLRQHQWERLPGGNGKENLARLKRTPLRMDCSYMITTWAAVPEDEHRLMTRALLALFRFPVLPEERLVGSLRNQPFDIPAMLACHDKLTNPAEVWASLDNEIRPTVSYIVTLALDPWKEEAREEPLVRTLTMRSGQVPTLPRHKSLLEETRGEMVFIGGTIRSKELNGAPLAGIRVAIQGRGLVATSDEQGRFSLGSISPGEYTLLAVTPGEKPKGKKITVPSGDGGYDLEL